MSYGSYTTRAAVREIQEIRTAEIEVQAATGVPVLGQDSAASVYAIGCHRLGVDASAVPAAGMKAVFKVAAQNRNNRPVVLAADSASVESWQSRFPGAKLARSV